MWNAISQVQDLNSCRRLHILRHNQSTNKLTDQPKIDRKPIQLTIYIDQFGFVRVNLKKEGLD